MSNQPLLYTFSSTVWDTLSLFSDNQLAVQVEVTKKRSVSELGSPPHITIPTHNTACPSLSFRTARPPLRLPAFPRAPADVVPRTTPGATPASLQFPSRMIIAFPSFVSHLHANYSVNWPNGPEGIFCFFTLVFHLVLKWSRPQPLDKANLMRKASIAISSSGLCRFVLTCISRAPAC